jgi:hypothetical protein
VCVRVYWYTMSKQSGTGMRRVCAGTPVQYVQTVRGRMRRVCAGTPVHYEQSSSLTWPAHSLQAYRPNTICPRTCIWQICFKSQDAV